MFSRETYIERRKTLAQSISSGIILLLGNEEMPMNYSDNTYHFRQDSTFLYYFGIDQPQLAGIIDADTGEALVFGDDAGVEMIVWAGKMPTLSSLCDRVGIGNHKPYSDLEKVIGEARSRNREIHFLPPYRIGNKLKLSGLLNKKIETVDDLVSLPLVKAVVAQREIKSAFDVARSRTMGGVSRFTGNNPVSWRGASL